MTVSLYPACASNEQAVGPGRILPEDLDSTIAGKTPIRVSATHTLVDFLDGERGEPLIFSPIVGMRIMKCRCMSPFSAGGICCGRGTPTSMFGERIFIPISAPSRDVADILKVEATCVIVELRGNFGVLFIQVSNHEHNLKSFSRGFLARSNCLNNPRRLASYVLGVLEPCEYSWGKSKRSMATSIWEAFTYSL